MFGRLDMTRRQRAPTNLNIDFMLHPENVEAIALHNQIKSHHISSKSETRTISNTRIKNTSRDISIRTELIIVFATQNAIAHVGTVMAGGMVLLSPRTFPSLGGGATGPARVVLCPIYVGRTVVRPVSDVLPRGGGRGGSGFSFVRCCVFLWREDRRETRG